uniref:J domain-containing protein n=1 Tax=Graphocephala atropunctata TaxID=36148 RepID=A0A1B6MD11_9HEMI
MDTENGNYYRILGCNESASVEEIKKCYHEKALACHPDKGKSDKGVNFDMINKAWKTLSNQESRHQYDAKLNEERISRQSLVFEMLSRNELIEKNSNTFTKKCRCGGLYVLDAEDMPEDCDISVECDTCSLVIVVR